MDQINYCIFMCAIACSALSVAFCLSLNVYIVHKALRPRANKQILCL